MLGSNIYMSDIIGELYTTWKDCLVILNGGTGCGKSHFVINVLIPCYVSQNKRILYLCNREKLEYQVKPQINRYPLVTVWTYQRLQAKLRKKKNLPKYDLIVSDECHYFWTDAKFNSYTDIAYQYVMSQTQSVVILMSATADSFFSELEANGKVEPDHIFKIEKSYSYVERVFTYKKDQLQDLIDYILSADDEEKILVFVNSIKRLEEMHEIYGTDAEYLCAKGQKCDFVNRAAVKECKFSKRILFTTKILDNGIDIKDDAVKHIISEIFDIDCMLQAIGRKRPIDSLDTCRLYFRIYDGRAINNFNRMDGKQLEAVEQYLDNKEQFIKTMCTLNLDARRIARENKIFYCDFGNEELKINEMALRKYRLDYSTTLEMKDSSYEKVLFDRLGSELSGKRAELKIYTQSHDIFLDYLKEIEGKKLFKEQQKELKSRFKDILGLHDRTMGINTLNGKLQDCQYQYVIESRRELSRKSEYFKKTYWIIGKI